MKSKKKKDVKKAQVPDPGSGEESDNRSHEIV
jgi:hypothetical protein